MTWVILTLVVVAVLVVAAVVIEQQRSAMLKRRFGPEYERAIDEHGDRRAAEGALRQRLKRRKSVELLDLTPATAERYSAQWRAVQAGFVDDPQGSVTSARTLVDQLIVERGYRDGEGADVGAGDRMELVAIDHPEQVAHYRDGRAPRARRLARRPAGHVHPLPGPVRGPAGRRHRPDGRRRRRRRHSERRPRIRFGASR